MELSPTVLQPSSPQAWAIHDLSLWILGVSAFIFVLVTVLVFLALWRSRRFTVPYQPPPVFGNPKLEILWVAIPFLIVLGLFLLTVRTMHAIHPGADPGEPDIVVTGHQWWWEISYPKEGILTANELHIPVGKRLLLRLESADVVHSFWVPALNRKMDLIPGKTNFLPLQAERPGRYEGVCAEFCGLQHAGMRLLVVAEEESDYRSWVAKQGEPLLAEGPAAEGFRIYSERTCITCHSSSAGPDLRHMGLRHTLAAGVIPNSREHLVQWLMDPHRFKPGVLMPNLGLSRDEAKALAVYLWGEP